MDWSVIVPNLVSLTIGLVSGFAAYRVARAQSLEAASNADDNITNRWKEYADTQKSDVEELKERLSALEQQLKDREDEYRDVRSIFNIARRHIQIMWDWIDSGANPPAPDRPRQLTLVIHNAAVIEEEHKE